MFNVRVVESGIGFSNPIQSEMKMFDVRVADNP